MMQVQEIMTTEIEYSMTTDTARKAGEVMRIASTGILPVLASEEDSRVVGVVTDRDLCMDVIALGRDSNIVAVSERMTDQVITCQPEDDVQHIAGVMAKAQVRRIPVVDGRGKLLEMVSLADFARHWTNFANIADTLHAITKPTSEPSAPRLLRAMVQSH